MTDIIRVVNQNNRATYFPSFIDYKEIIDLKKKTINGEPFIEISIKEWELCREKEMVVVNGLLVEYKKTNEELLTEKKLNELKERESFLKSSFDDLVMNYDPDNIPQEIKEKRRLVREEIEKIKQDINLNTI